MKPNLRDGVMGLIPNGVNIITRLQMYVGYAVVLHTTGANAAPLGISTKEVSSGTKKGQAVLGHEAGPLAPTKEDTAPRHSRGTLLLLPHT